MFLFTCISLFFWFLYIVSLFYDVKKYRVLGGIKVSQSSHLLNVGVSALNDFDYLAVVPAHNESFVIGSTIKALFKSGFKTVLVVCDACTDDTRQEALLNGALVVEEDFKNKDRAVKTALYDYFDFISNVPSGVFIFDADNITDVNFLKNCIPYLGSDLVQFRWYNKNNNSILSRSIGAFSSLFFAIQRGMMVFFHYSFFGGTCSYIPYNLLSDYLSIPTFGVVEDFSNSFYMYKKGHRVLFIDVPGIYCYNENVTSFRALFLQRLRWARGLIYLLVNKFKDLRTVPVFLFFPVVIFFASVSSVLIFLNFVYYYIFTLIFLIFPLLVFIKRPDRLGLVSFLLIPFALWVCSLSCLVGSFTYNNLKWARTEHKIKEVI